MEAPPSDARMESTTPVISQSADPSPSQSSSLQHQQPNPNSPNNNNNNNRVQFNNRQPTWVGPTPGSIAIGVPANSPQPPPNSVYTSPSSVRPSMSSTMHLRPGGLPQSGLPQHRAIGPPHSSSPMPPLPQNYQGQGILRAPSASSPSTPSTSQSQQSSHQPWLSTQQGRPPMPSLRPQVTSSPTMQQRPHIPQHSAQQPIPAASQPQQMMSIPPQQQQQQHFTASIHPQDNSGQQLSSSRHNQPSMNQQHISRVQASTHQRPQGMYTDNLGRSEPLESCTRILSKRNIQELVHQVDPLENLDPEVEDVLVDIADDFINSVTTFGCSLAKHRKSNTLEAKDILLHLERTWNMTLPGFNGDDIKTYKKAVGNEIHNERLAVIKKSVTGAEVNKSSVAQAAGNVKGHLAKPTHNISGS